MEATGDISKVNQPAPWCASIPKKTGLVRICFDFKPLNGQEVHPVAKVDDILLGKLAGATIFSNQQQVTPSSRIPAIDYLYNAFWLLLF